jgi:chromosome segregation protein
MHIKKLEICGFKSFVDKTVIHFDHDVIGVVGPNGCGKSNIVDAIRWCMGEQSAKHLRGRSMEDVIFNGSESRPPTSVAEVTLTFDNSDETYAATLPETYRAFPEIAVTRRLFRDGTSEYLLNKTAVRLRDVTDLFLGTGVGTKAYSIIEQGRVGQIVTSRPQDRRTYIEEAAGVTKYRLRRKQAERKLELTRQNLLRINDITQEIDRNRATLKRQAAKAERYVSYRSELEDLFLHDASHRLLELIVTERVRSTGRAVAAERVSEARQQLTDGDAALLAARVEAGQIEQRFVETSERRAQADQRVTQHASEGQRLRERITHLEERARAFGDERNTLVSRTEHLRTDLLAIEERVAALDVDESGRDEEAKQENAELLEAQQQERAITLELQRLRQSLSRHQTESATLRSRLDGLAQREVDLEANRERVRAEQAELANDRELLVAAHEAATVALQALSAKTAEATQHRQALEAERLLVEQTRAANKKALAEVTETLSLKRSRLAVLQDLHERLEGVRSGTRALLTSSDPAVVGLLADRIDVADGYADALVGVLGERLHTVIVEDPERGLELLAGLREGKQGRATIASRRPAPETEREYPAADDPSVVCRLIEQLEYEAEDHALLRALVGDALVVRTAAAAFELNQRFPGTRVVALDGTVVRGNGLVSGGSDDDVAAALLEQKREIRELTDALEALVASHAQAETAVSECEQKLTALGGELEAARRAEYEAQAARSSAERDLARTAGDRARNDERLARIEGEASRFGEQEGGFLRDRQAWAEGLRDLADREAEDTKALEAAEARAAVARDDAAMKGARVLERSIRLGQLREQLDAQRTAHQRASTELGQATLRLETLERELVETEDAAAAAQASLLTSEEALTAAIALAKELEVQVEDTRALLEQVRDSLSQKEGELRALRSSVEEIDQELRDHEMELQKLTLGREHLLNSVSERFRGLDLNRVVGDYHKRPPPDLEHRRRIDELTKLIDRMGPVNLDAREEYETAERRYAELSEQQKDIEQAVQELERAIRHMDRESRRRFKETFDAVNELFKKSFGRLFKGGRAELKLTDPENLLETGVDIIAQPPGKRLGNIELMSGGEKALTAAALIFAIFQYRPSPFCVLDEVDAPLDDANVGRYVEAIRGMTESSQFILITHIKQTMQSVDVLYGVTMGEPGVSRVVSVKVNDAVASRSARRIPETTDAPETMPAQVVA